MSPKLRGNAVYSKEVMFVSSNTKEKSHYVAFKEREGSAFECIISATVLGGLRKVTKSLVQCSL
jgi:hypothetical protein